jgi:hypothetical protein
MILRKKLLIIKRWENISNPYLIFSFLYTKLLRIYSSTREWTNKTLEHCMDKRKSKIAFQDGTYKI